MQISSLMEKILYNFGLYKKIEKEKENLVGLLDDHISYEDKLKKKVRYYRSKFLKAADSVDSLLKEQEGVKPEDSESSPVPFWTTWEQTKSFVRCFHFLPNRFLSEDEFFLFFPKKQYQTKSYIGLISMFNDPEFKRYVRGLEYDNYKAYCKFWKNMKNNPQPIHFENKTKSSHISTFDILFEDPPVLTHKVESGKFIEN